MAGHLRTRIWSAATTPVVRELGPVLTGLFKTVAQFIAFTVIGCLILILVYFVPDGVPMKPVVMLVSLVPMLFGFIVVADMVWLTYRKPEEVVYPTVEAFPDREPI